MNAVVVFNSVLLLGENTSTPLKMQCSKYSLTEGVQGHQGITWVQEIDEMTVTAMVRVSV